jgi:transcriptional regulator with XRE-family HTH domain
MQRFSHILTERAVDISMDRFLTSREVGRRVRWAREQARLTRAELAAYVGVSESTLQNVEHGRRWLKPSERAAIARAIGCSISLLSVTPNGNGRKPRVFSNGPMAEPQLSLEVER